MEAVLHEELTGCGSAANSPIPSPECSLGCQSTVGCIRWALSSLPRCSSSKALDSNHPHLKPHT
jgi:hypothetical protein